MAATTQKDIGTKFGLAFIEDSDFMIGFRAARDERVVAAIEAKNKERLEQAVEELLARVHTK